MITPESIYWITRLDALSNFFNLISALSIFGIVICFLACLGYFCYKINYDESMSLTKPLIVLLLFVLFAIVGGIGSIFTPTTKEMTAIYLIPQIIQDESIKETSPKLYNIGSEYAKKKLGIDI